MRKPTDSFILYLLAFAAGMMLSISFLQLLPESIALSSVWFVCLGLLAGGLLMFLLDKFIPHIHAERTKGTEQQKIERTSLYLLVGILLHHFPEGMAIGLGHVIGYQASIIIALAIALHDIPESICTSAPYYYATGKRLRSFLLSAATSIPTLLGYFFATLLAHVISSTVIGIIIAMTAGLMIYISVDELIPISCGTQAKGNNYGHIFSLLFGVLSVILLQALS